MLGEGPEGTQKIWVGMTALGFPKPCDADLNKNGECKIGKHGYTHEGDIVSTPLPLGTSPSKRDARIASSLFDCALLNA